MAELAQRPLHLPSSWKIRYPEYFRVKCYNGISVRLRNSLWELRNTNKHFWRCCRRTIAVVIYEPSLPVYPFFLPFSLFYPYSMDSLYINKFSALKGEFLEPPQSSKPITASSFELRLGFIAMVREQSFSGFDDENTYHHLREFEQLCSCLSIAGMAQEI